MHCTLPVACSACNPPAITGVTRKATPLLTLSWLEAGLQGPAIRGLQR